MCDKVDIKTNPNLVIALGEYIRNKKTKKSIGLREMADMLNISPAYLSNLELGKHNMTNPLLLKNIAMILEIDHLKLYKIIGYTDKERRELR
uniref:helix-turn-helix domain-containing protein n=1 Tax=Streptobacillus moniliformis TaxID=34105 RepID=UPI0007E2EA4C